MIYVVILVAVIYLPSKVGGWDAIFSAAQTSFDTFNKDNADAIAAGSVPGKALIPPPPAQWAYATLALGSALALFMYPHSITGVLSTRSRSVIRRNAALLPAYSFLLGLLALLGFVAIAAGVKVENPQQSVPQLFENEFPGWFAGVGLAAIAIGALVPAAIMSIAAANLWTRNIYRAFLNRDATPQQEATQSKVVSLVVKFGALVFVLAFSKQFAINLQLLGGVWILQTLLAIVGGLSPGGSTGGHSSPGGPPAWLTARGGRTASRFPAIPAATSAGRWCCSRGPRRRSTSRSSPFLLNVIVTVVLTVVLRAAGVDAGTDRTRPDDYTVAPGRPGRRGGTACDPQPTPAHA